MHSSIVSSCVLHNLTYLAAVMTVEIVVFSVGSSNYSGLKLCHRAQALTRSLVVAVVMLSRQGSTL
jgi:PleD family two-component response regulator